MELNWSDRASRRSETFNELHGVRGWRQTNCELISLALHPDVELYVLNLGDDRRSISFLRSLARRVGRANSRIARAHSESAATEAAVKAVISYRDCAVKYQFNGVADFFSHKLREYFEASR